MSDQNKQWVKRFYDEVMNGQNLGAIDELCAADVVDHFPLPGQAPGVKGLKDVFSMWIKAFPDLRVNVEEMVAERDFVVSRFTGTATHKGELLGAAPTNKQVTFHGLDMIRLKDGKAVEVWHHGDDAVVLMQLGVKLPV